ncbi:MAG: glycosyltransferase [Aquamicrobium sp.]|uniref:glycosyltransferase n=1 Tax=Aquamicrobium sp. TaxID=1872579 RepID=UPI00349E4DA9|nr:glycosyltransferase [Aquamicrobium sp.]
MSDGAAGYPRSETPQKQPGAGSGPRGAEIAVFHDHFSIRGGGERLVLTLAQALGADLVHGYATPATYEPAMFPEGTVDLGLPNALRRGGVRAVALGVLFARQRRRAGAYSTRIFSGVAAPLAAPERSRTGRNIFYCHTPPRFLFDQREHFLGQLGGAARLAAGPVLARFERAYLAAVGRMDVILTNSQNTRRRIRDYLGRDSEVVYPPCPTASFAWKGQDDYYLSTARLSGLKRVDVIVEAFLRLPDKRLLVASGGEERERLERMAAGAPNIEFLGWSDEVRLRELIGRAVATIYVPREEDFGMSPVESMAAGKPVIGVAEGGLTETIVDGETGILLDRTFSAGDLAEAVHALTPDRAAAMRAACEARAALFTEERFIDSMKRHVEAARAALADRAQ